MELLICPICKRALAKRGQSLTCEDSHSFDLSREGYVNLLVGAKGQHGDNKLMLSGRRTFLEHGFYGNLKEAVSGALRAYAKEDGVLLDVGCGEGYYTAGMAKALPRASVYGFDISREAVRLAAKRKCGSFFVGSAYEVPMRAESADAVTLLFSPFCREEILRVLKKDGIFIMAVPGERHLLGLKSVLYDEPYLNTPEDAALDGFTLLSHTHLENEITVEGGDMIEALFSMTPYYYKTSREGHERLARLESLKTETAFELFVYKKSV